jgi:hypothetical protein
VEWTVRLLASPVTENEVKTKGVRKEGAGEALFF